MKKFPMLFEHFAIPKHFIYVYILFMFIHFVELFVLLYFTLGFAVCISSRDAFSYLV